MLDFEAAWRQLISQQVVGLVEVDAQHPFRRFYGLDAEHHAQLVFLSDEEPPLPPLSNLVSANRGRREADGLWTLSLTLLETEFTEIFVRLGADLSQRSQHATDSKSGLARVFAGLDAWRRLLSPAEPQRLSDEMLRGLIGEVWTARHILTDRLDVRAVVNGWVGPYGNPQDFHFPGQVSVEVKTIRPSAKTVKISSSEQLDNQWVDLELFVVTLADASPAEKDALSLAALARSLRLLHIESGGTGTEVDARFELLGVDLNDAYYSNRRFTVRQSEAYAVVDEFPAIRVSELAPGVANVKYEISRVAMEPFLTSRSTIQP